MSCLYFLCLRSPRGGRGQWLREPASAGHPHPKASSLTCSVHKPLLPRLSSCPHRSVLAGLSHHPGLTRSWLNPPSPLPHLPGGSGGQGASCRPGLLPMVPRPLGRCRSEGVMSLPVCASGLPACPTCAQVCCPAALRSCLVAKAAPAPGPWAPGLVPPRTRLAGPSSCPATSHKGAARSLPRLPAPFTAAPGPVHGHLLVSLHPPWQPGPNRRPHPRPWASSSHPGVSGCPPPPGSSSPADPADPTSYPPTPGAYPGQPHTCAPASRSPAAQLWAPHPQQTHQRPTVTVPALPRGSLHPLQLPPVLLSVTPHKAQRDPLKPRPSRPRSPCCKPCRLGWSPCGGLHSVQWPAWPLRTPGRWDARPQSAQAEISVPHACVSQPRGRIGPVLLSTGRSLALGEGRALGKLCRRCRVTCTELCPATAWAARPALLVFGRFLPLCGCLQMCSLGPTGRTAGPAGPRDVMVWQATGLEALL